jgi:hypothetical protein
VFEIDEDGEFDEEYWAERKRAEKAKWRAECQARAKANLEQLQRLQEEIRCLKTALEAKEKLEKLGP